MAEKKEVFLEEKIRAEGWNAVDLVEQKKLPQGLCELAINIAKGNYTSGMVIPANTLLKDQGKSLFECKYVVYAKLSRKYKQKLKKEEKYVGCAIIHMATFRDKDMPMYHQF